MAKKNMDSPQKLEDIIDRIQQLSKRSRVSARHCMDLLQGDTACNDLVKDMKFSANRLLADIQYDLAFEGEAFLPHLSKGKRNDLFLFYKECLTNIARHASASSCQIQLTATAESIRLRVEDNGLGVASTPHSLQRRAQFLGARVSVETPDTGGTRIILQLSTRRWRGKHKPNTVRATQSEDLKTTENDHE